MKVIGYGFSDIGKVRSENEDSFLIDNELGLYVVCDGLGGHAGGALASQTAISTVQSYLTSRLPRSGPSGSGLELNWETHHSRTLAIVSSAIDEACDEIQKIVEEERSLTGMGTTLTMLLRVDNKVVMAHIGDSRLYLMRRGKIHQISRDHTVAQELMEQGIISPEEARTSSQSHVLTRALGLGELVPIDTLCFDLVPNDVCLLCSDGFSNSVYDLTELEEFIEASASEKLSAALVQTANERDGSDNITVVTVHATKDSEAPNLDKNGTEAPDSENERILEIYLKTDTLQKLFLFEEFSLQELLLVLEEAQTADFSKGDVAVREGDTGTTLYVILSGEFAVTRAEKNVATLGDGDHFGEMALISDAPRSASVIASKPSPSLKART